MKTIPRTTWWSAYYCFWILMFLGPELYWVFANPVNTLSDQVWAFEHLNMANPWFTQWTAVHWVVFVVVFLLWTWLLVHIPFGLAR
jgi:hypothetical protein